MPSRASKPFNEIRRERERRDRRREGRIDPAKVEEAAELVRKSVLSLLDGKFEVTFSPPPFRCISLIRNNPCLGPYSRLMPRALWWSEGGRGGGRG